MQGRLGNLGKPRYTKGIDKAFHMVNYSSTKCKSRISEDNLCFERVDLRRDIKTLIKFVFNLLIFLYSVFHIAFGIKLCHGNLYSQWSGWIFNKKLWKIWPGKWALIYSVDILGIPYSGDFFHCSSLDSWPSNSSKACQQGSSSGWKILVHGKYQCNFHYRDIANPQEHRGIYHHMIFFQILGGGIKYRGMPGRTVLEEMKKEPAWENILKDVR